MRGSTDNAVAGEILPRFKQIEVVREPMRTRSNLFRGYSSLPDVIERLETARCINLNRYKTVVTILLRIRR